ncbi:DUF6973 domain-containing protein [Tenacibaculum maritimum]|uniref:DUF6973 domain-containing protein n=1 Tax=Tenacibaculum maritimum TaxID=107401 RepID=UPI0012E4CB5A|nr:hypothetical protein [Tenacibaculum maritimum]CAA0227447.1 conserved hypothetical protein [Tenacibaculum maritimum]CAA0234996.1 conserved hypothetical protein [Tenacibaculum maritimum]
MKKTSFLFFFVLINHIVAQSNWKQFKNLSGPKKTWVLFHPFKAKLAFEISKDARKIADSIKKTTVLDGDASGGQVDAFRHTFWMARLHQSIGKAAACSLGKAHERENYQTYKKKKLEDGIVPDLVSSEMDLYNNNIGLNLVTKRDHISKNSLIYLVINKILKGEMKIVKKDKKGNYLNCKGAIISPDSLKGKWKNKKCLVPSNKIAKQ